MGFEAILQQEYIDSAIKALDDTIEHFNLNLDEAALTDVQNVMVEQIQGDVNASFAAIYALNEAGHIEPELGPVVEVYFKERFGLYEPQGELAQRSPEAALQVADAGSNGALPERGPATMGVSPNPGTTLSV